MLRKRDILPTLESLISRSRNIVLIGHDIRNELNVLQVLKFDLHTSIVGILDIQRIALELFQTGPSTLTSVLEALECPYNKLHTAGNDAYFTLKALLLLAERSCDNITTDENDLDIMASIRTVLKSCVFQPKLDPQEKKARRKQLKRQERIWKQQSKLWDEQTKERIREERAGRRKTRTGCFGEGYKFILPKSMKYFR
jgi:DNA polymerase III epsilon subunit-like protein